MESIKKIKRISRVVSVLTKYGFEELIDRLNLDKSGVSVSDEIEGVSYVERNTVYERIRMTLEALGPTYVKLGQLLSNRADLIPPDLIAELEKLQDHVPVEAINFEEKLRSELGIDPKAHFNFIEEQPFAAASISQVYRAQLIDGQDVIIKVKRTDIQKIVAADLAVIKDVVSLLEHQYVKVKKMYLSHIIKTFENNMQRELSFVSELSNIEKFRNNFHGNPDIYVPRVYKEYSTNNILCMEFIDGFKISDKQAILHLGLDPKEVVNRGLDLYLKQVLDHGFFHADPHPGNIFINRNKQIVFIDFGSMGVIHQSDREDIEEFLIQFIQRNPRKVIKAIKKLAIDCDIEDEKQFGRDLFDLYELLNETDLEHLDIQVVINKLNLMLQQNHILMPEYIYLLLRGVALIEGIGKQLNAGMNIRNSVEPYILQMAKERIAPKILFKQAINSLRDIRDILQELPQETSHLVEKVSNDRLIINHKLIGLQDLQKTVKRSFDNVTVALIICALAVSSTFLYVHTIENSNHFIHIIIWIEFILMILLIIFLLVRIIKRK